MAATGILAASVGAVPIVFYYCMTIQQGVIYHQQDFFFQLTVLEDENQEHRAVISSVTGKAYRFFPQLNMEVKIQGWVAENFICKVNRLTKKKEKEGTSCRDPRDEI